MYSQRTSDVLELHFYQGSLVAVSQVAGKWTFLDTSLHPSDLKRSKLVEKLITYFWETDRIFNCLLKMKAQGTKSLDLKSLPAVLTHK